MWKTKYSDALNFSREEITSEGAKQIQLHNIYEHIGSKLLHRKLLQEPDRKKLRIIYWPIQH